MTKRGWLYDIANSRGGIYVEGTEVVRIDDATNNIQILGTAGMTIDAGGLTVTAGGVTVTAGGILVTAGGATILGGGLTVITGNIITGSPGAFATTQPTTAVVMDSGTAPAGAITTARCGVLE